MATVPLASGFSTFRTRSVFRVSRQNADRTRMINTCALLQPQHQHGMNNGLLSDVYSMSFARHEGTRDSDSVVVLNNP